MNYLFGSKDPEQDKVMQYIKDHSDELEDIDIKVNQMRSDFDDAFGTVLEPRVSKIN